jgi:hypothetical protein
MAGRVRGGDPPGKGGSTVEALETYSSVLAVVGVALLLVFAGLGKKQLTWKQRPVPRRRRWGR